jgi:hypothetical protein
MELEGDIAARDSQVAHMAEELESINAKVEEWKRSHYQVEHKLVEE